MIDIETTDTSNENVNTVMDDLAVFIETEGLKLFKERLSDKFQTDAPSKSGKSKREIKASKEGVTLPIALWRVDQGRAVIDSSGMQLSSASKGTGFIDEVLDDDDGGMMEIWTDIITKWGEARSDITYITLE